MRQRGLTRSNLPGTWSVKKVNGKLTVIDVKTKKVWAELSENSMKANAGGGVRDWNHLLNVKPPLMKKFRYEVDGGRFIYETDELGRVSKITDNDVRYDTPRKRNEPEERKAKELKDGVNPGDDGGHMNSHESGGPAEQINYFPQNPNYNKGKPGTWRKMEEYLRKLKLDNPSHNFKLEIVPVFPSGSKRPKEFRVQISKNGNILDISDIDISGKSFNFEIIDNPLN